MSGDGRDHARSRPGRPANVPDDEHARSAAPDPARPPSVLIVDDDPDVRLAVSMLLSRAGHRVFHAGDGQEACEVLASHRDEVDVVLLDVLMPVLNGTETLPRLRGIVPGLPVVFYSGYDQGEVARHITREPPYTSFLQKPAERQELVDELQRAHDSRR